MNGMANPIRCVAIDDEPLALDVISKFCKRRGGMDLTTFSDPQLGLETIMREKPAIAFLDIEIGNISGLDIASQLPKETCFIFTTAYLDYAIDGFELDAVDYLHKPFAYSRFVTAIEKALRRLGINAGTSTGRSLLVKQDYANVSIPLADILYIEAMEGYVKIFRENNECTVSRVILKNIGSQLPADEFIRIHRSFIVQKSKIKSFTKKEVELTNGKCIPVGRQYSGAISSLM